MEEPTFFGPGIVLSAVGARCGKTFEASGDWGTVANTAVLQPQPGFDTRFLWYMTNDESFWEKGGAAQPYVRVDATLSRRLAFPPLDEQRAIVHYLDAETSRIDALIAKKRQMVTLLSERAAQALAEALEEADFMFPDSLTPSWGAVELPVGWRVIRLSQVLRQLTNGYVGPTRDILLDDGIRYVQSLHVKNGVIEFGRRPFFVSEEWHRERPRIHLRAGDVLIVQTGDIGQVAVVPRGFGEASCHALQIARVHEHIITGEYLGAYLRSPFGYQSLLSRATGALHPHLEGGIRDVPVVVPPLAEQDVVVRTAALVRQRCERLESKLARQMALLVERRKALITAAVIGEIDLPGAAA